MTDSLVDETPWLRSVTQAISVKRALGCGIVTWPSGRLTMETYFGVVTMSNLEECCTMYPERIRAQKVENLSRTLTNWRTRTWRDGWFIRLGKRRPKARRAIAIEWMRPSAYTGSPVGKNGLIPQRESV